MNYSKIYSNRTLFEGFSAVIKREAGACTSDEISEAIRIRRKEINIDNVVRLLQMTDNELKTLKRAVVMAEELSKTTNEVPRLCDL